MNTETIKTPELLSSEQLNHRVYVLLRDQIIKKELSPGARLVDSQIAQNLGISRTPVRDAIRKLADEGLVFNKSQRGFYVYKLKQQDIVAMFEFRLVFHRWIPTKLISEILPANYGASFERLQEIHRELRAGIAMGGEYFTQYDEAFHFGLAALTNNPFVMKAYVENTTQLKIFRYNAAADKNHVTTVNQMHLDLITAIKEMDLEKALQIVAEHTVISRKAALTVYSDE